jgi:hypothetical protein
MSPASSDASMLAVADPAPLRPTLVAVDSCTRQHANLLVPGQIVSGLVLIHYSGTDPAVGGRSSNPLTVKNSMEPPKPLLQI